MRQIALKSINNCFPFVRKACRGLNLTRLESNTPLGTRALNRTRYEGRSAVTDKEKVEEIARHLCRAAGQNPDAKIRLGEPLSFAAGDCTIVKPLIVPAWKAYSREARRLAMSDAEHAESRARARKPRRKPIVRLLCSPRILAVVLRRRLRPLQIATRLRALRVGGRRGLSARAAMLSQQESGS